MQPKNHLELEKKQIKSLLLQFRKNKMRCLQLCEQANQDMPDLQRYEILEVTCTRKIDSLQLMSVIRLKQELASSISAVGELERELTAKLFRDNFKKPPKAARRAFKVKEAIAEEVGPFRIPQYQTHDESNELKIDRLSTFILTLGRSMTALRGEITGEWREEEFVRYEPEWVELRARLERYRLRQEELAVIAEREFEKELGRMVEKGERVMSGTGVSDDQEYEVVKIPRKRIESYGRDQGRGRHFGELEQQYHPFSMIEPGKRARRKQKKVTLDRIVEEKPTPVDGSADTASPANNPLHRVHSQAILDGLTSSNRHNTTSDSNYEDEAEAGNYVYMMKKKGGDQLSSSLLSSISSLRSLRRKVFDDDIWDEFEKM